jgi:hypothetical protein
MRKAALPLLVAAVLVVVSLLAVGGSLSGPAQWSPDGLFYQAKIYELQGDNEQTALTRAFQGPLGAELRSDDPERSGDPAWVAYNERFYERRLGLPLAGAALQPVSGDRALLDVSLAGYVVAVLAVFWLLLLRFRLPIAALGGLATALLPALSFHSSFPLTDSWGLALEAVAIGSALLVLQRSRRWLIPWALAIAVLSITRDSQLVLVLAAAGLAVFTRTRASYWLLATGALAALPAMLAITVPMRELLAQMLTADLQPRPDASWGTIIADYPGALVELVRANGGFVRDGAFLSAAYLGGGLIALFAFGRRAVAGDLFLMLGALAGVLYVLTVPVFSAFRLELVWVPFAAVGLGLAAERVMAFLHRPVALRSPAVAGKGAGT